MDYPLEIEHDLAVYHNRCIGEWLRGEMSSRKFLMYLQGLLFDGRTAEGWFARAVHADWQDLKTQQEAAAEREARAVNKAQITGQPLSMADLQP